MREYVVEYKQPYENFTHKLRYHADFINDAMKRFYDDKVFVGEWVKIKEYDTPYYYTIKYEDEDEYTYHYDTFEDLMNRVSYVMAFSDCGPEIQFFEVYVEGKEITYDGWRPGMRYIWIDADNSEIVWDRSYSHWDH